MNSRKKLGVEVVGNRSNAKVLAGAKGRPATSSSTRGISGIFVSTTLKGQIVSGTAAPGFSLGD